MSRPDENPIMKQPYMKPEKNPQIIGGPATIPARTMTKSAAVKLKAPIKNFMICLPTNDDVFALQDDEAFLLKLSVDFLPLFIVDWASQSSKRI